MPPVDEDKLEESEENHRAGVLLIVGRFFLSSMRAQACQGGGF